MSPARFVGLLQDLQGSCRRNKRIALAIFALFDVPAWPLRLPREPYSKAYSVGFA
jgi:hypothetical protein